MLTLTLTLIITLLSLRTIIIVRREKKRLFQGNGINGKFGARLVRPCSVQPPLFVRLVNANAIPVYRRWWIMERQEDEDGKRGEEMGWGEVRWDRRGEIGEEKNSNLNFSSRSSEKLNPNTSHPTVKVMPCTSPISHLPSSARSRSKSKSRKHASRQACMHITSRKTEMFVSYFTFGLVWLGLAWFDYLYFAREVWVDRGGEGRWERGKGKVIKRHRGSRPDSRRGEERRGEE